MQTFILVHIIHTYIQTYIIYIYIGTGTFEYYIKIVPTIYHDLKGAKLHTNQYSVTDHFRKSLVRFTDADEAESSNDAHHGLDRAFGISPMSKHAFLECVMCEYTCLHIYIYIYIYIHTYIHVRMYACIHVCMCMCI
jgi:hypothetical protein